MYMVMEEVGRKTGRGTFPMFAEAVSLIGEEFNLHLARDKS